MKIHIRSKGKDKQDSFWYDGLIAETKTHTLYATGDVKVEAPNEEVYRDDHAREWANDMGWDDQSIENDFVWIHENWFEIQAKNSMGAEGKVYHNYNEAIAALAKCDKVKK